MSASKIVWAKDTEIAILINNILKLTTNEFHLC